MGAQRLPRGPPSPYVGDAVEAAPGPGRVRPCARQVSTEVEKMDSSELETLKWKQRDPKGVFEKFLADQLALLLLQSRRL